MCSFNFPVHVKDFLHCTQGAYDWSDFQLGWMTFCILCTCTVSLHCGWAMCGWACVGLCDCGIIALVAFIPNVCFGVISHEQLFRWKSCIGYLWPMGTEKNRVRMTIFGSKMGWYIGNSLAEETTKDVRWLVNWGSGSGIFYSSRWEGFHSFMCWEFWR